MEPTSHLLDLIDHFRRTLGLDELTFDSDGIIEFTVDDEIEIMLAVDRHQEALILAAEVYPDADQLGPKNWRRLLVTNTRLADSDRASFAIVPASGSLILQQRIPLRDLTYPAFEQIWIAFVNDREFAAAKLTKPVDAEKKAGANREELSLEDQHRLFLRV